MKEKIKEAVILPGSYDPITIGHLDIIRQAAEKYQQEVMRLSPANQACMT